MRALCSSLTVLAVFAAASASAQPDGTVAERQWVELGEGARAARSEPRGEPITGVEVRRAHGVCGGLLGLTSSSHGDNRNFYDRCMRLELRIVDRTAAVDEPTRAAVESQSSPNVVATVLSRLRPLPAWRSRSGAAAASPGDPSAHPPETDPEANPGTDATPRSLDALCRGQLAELTALREVARRNEILSDGSWLEVQRRCPWNRGAHVLVVFGYQGDRLTLAGRGTAGWWSMQTGSHAAIPLEERAEDGPRGARVAWVVTVPTALQTRLAGRLGVRLDRGREQLASAGRPLRLLPHAIPPTGDLRTASFALAAPQPGCLDLSLRMNPDERVGVFLDGDQVADPSNSGRLNLRVEVARELNGGIDQGILSHRIQMIPLAGPLSEPAGDAPSNVLLEHAVDMGTLPPTLACLPIVLDGRTPRAAQLVRVNVGESCSEAGADPAAVRRATFSALVAIYGARQVENTGVWTALARSTRGRESALAGLGEIARERGTRDQLRGLRSVLNAVRSRGATVLYEASLSCSREPGQGWGYTYAVTRLDLAAARGADSSANGRLADHLHTASTTASRTDELRDMIVSGVRQAAEVSHVRLMPIQVRGAYWREFTLRIEASLADNALPSPNPASLQEDVVPTSESTPDEPPSLYRLLIRREFVDRRAWGCDEVAESGRLRSGERLLSLELQTPAREADRVRLLQTNFSRQWFDQLLSREEELVQEIPRGVAQYRWTLARRLANPGAYRFEAQLQHRIDEASDWLTVAEARRTKRAMTERGAEGPADAVRSTQCRHFPVRRRNVSAYLGYHAPVDGNVQSWRASLLLVVPFFQESPFTMGFALGYSGGPRRLSASWDLAFDQTFTGGLSSLPETPRWLAHAAHLGLASSLRVNLIAGVELTATGLLLVDLLVFDVRSIDPRLGTLRGSQDETIVTASFGGRLQLGLDIPLGSDVRAELGWSFSLRHGTANGSGSVEGEGAQFEMGPFLGVTL